MPLVDNEFQRGKCGLKLLQYMAAGLPVIASPVGVNTDIAKDAGLLASHPAEWKQAIEHFATHPSAMKLLGLAGRKRCEQNFSLARWSSHLLQLFETICRNGAQTS
jgi:glycosyltransferase involved in cell wall biosynthesis